MGAVRLQTTAWIIGLLCAVLLAACGGTPEDPTAEQGGQAEGATAAPATGGSASTESPAGETQTGTGEEGPIRIGISLPLTVTSPNPARASARATSCGRPTSTSRVGCSAGRWS